MTRRRGLIAHTLNHEELINAVQLAHPDRDLKHAIVLAPVYLIETPDCTALVNYEGVGTQLNPRTGTIEVVLDHSGYGNLERFDLSLDKIRPHVTAESIDLADAIRTFGDRLDSNHSLWFRRAYPNGLPLAAPVDETPAPEMPEILKGLVAEGEEYLTTDQAREKYAFEGFAAPYVVVRRKSDGVTGLLTFTHQPRYYYGFEVA